ncbi:MAG: transcription elongation factor GreAB [Burkholderiales bacterium]|nr:transcription elongation factor GreAB [Burkholderiales bacterium]
MRAESLPPVRLTRSDFAQLERLLATYARARPSRAAEILGRELARARVVERGEIPHTVVTMHSQIRLRDEHTGRERTVTLVYPSERGSTSDALSILTSLGAALIGLTEGHEITFTGPDGRMRRVALLKVLRQAEDALNAPDSHGAGVTAAPR